MKIKDLFRSKKKNTGTKQVQVGNYSLTANAEHPIEHYLKQFKYYSRNLPRIAKHIESKYLTYGIVDVGANIGDTVALLRSGDVNQTLYAVEGEPTYFALLQKNLPQFQDVQVFETFLGDSNHTVNATAEVNEGTAKLNSNSGKKIEVQKLDDLVKTNNLQNVKLLKVDTDGFDFKILRGGLNFIKEQRPVLFFEYDAVYLEEQNEDGTEMFDTLRGLGYTKAMYYDNYGKFLLSLTLDNMPLITQLYNYMRKKESAFPYYDVCVFHGDDDALADEVIAKETGFFK